MISKVVSEQNQLMQATVHLPAVQKILDVSQERKHNFDEQKHNSERLELESLGRVKGICEAISKYFSTCNSTEELNINDISRLLESFRSIVYDSIIELMSKLKIRIDQLDELNNRSFANLKLCSPSQSLLFNNLQEFLCFASTVLDQVYEKSLNLECQSANLVELQNVLKIYAGDSPMFLLSEAFAEHLNLNNIESEVQLSKLASTIRFADLVIDSSIIPKHKTKWYLSRKIPNFQEQLLFAIETNQQIFKDNIFASDIFQLRPSITELQSQKTFRYKYYANLDYILTLRKNRPDNYLNICYSANTHVHEKLDIPDAVYIANNPEDRLFQRINNFYAIGIPVPDLNSIQCYPGISKIIANSTSSESETKIRIQFKAVLEAHLILKEQDVPRHFGDRDRLFSATKGNLYYLLDYFEKYSQFRSDSGKGQLEGKNFDFESSLVKFEIMRFCHHELIKSAKKLLFSADDSIRPFENPFIQDLNLKFELPEICHAVKYSGPLIRYLIENTFNPLLDLSKAVHREFFENIEFTNGDPDYTFTGKELLLEALGEDYPQILLNHAARAISDLPKLEEVKNENQLINPAEEFVSYNYLAATEVLKAVFESIKNSNKKITDQKVEILKLKKLQLISGLVLMLEETLELEKEPGRRTALKTTLINIMGAFNKSIVNVVKELIDPKNKEWTKEALAQIKTCSFSDTILSTPDQKLVFNNLQELLTFAWVVNREISKHCGITSNLIERSSITKKALEEELSQNNCSVHLSPKIFLNLALAEIAGERNFTKDDFEKDYTQRIDVNLKSAIPWNKRASINNMTELSANIADTILILRSIFSENEYAKFIGIDLFPIYDLSESANVLHRHITEQQIGLMSYDNKQNFSFSEYINTERTSRKLLASVPKDFLDIEIQKLARQFPFADLLEKQKSEFPLLHHFLAGFPGAYYDISSDYLAFGVCLKLLLSLNRTDVSQTSDPFINFSNLCIVIDSAAQLLFKSNAIHSGGLYETADLKLGGKSYILGNMEAISVTLQSEFLCLISSILESQSKKIDNRNLSNAIANEEYLLLKKISALKNIYELDLKYSKDHLRKQIDPQAAKQILAKALEEIYGAELSDLGLLINSFDKLMLKLKGDQSQRVLNCNVLMQIAYGDNYRGLLTKNKESVNKESVNKDKEAAVSIEPLDSDRVNKRKELLDVIKKVEAYTAVHLEAIASGKGMQYLIASGLDDLTKEIKAIEKFLENELSGDYTKILSMIDNFNQIVEEVVCYAGMYMGITKNKPSLGYSLVAVNKSIAFSNMQELLCFAYLINLKFQNIYNSDLVLNQKPLDIAKEHSPRRLTDKALARRIRKPEQNVISKDEKTSRVVLNFDGHLDLKILHKVELKYRIANISNLILIFRNICRKNIPAEVLGVDLLPIANDFGHIIKISDLMMPLAVIEFDNTSADEFMQFNSHHFSAVQISTTDYAKKIDLFIKKYVQIDAFSETLKCFGDQYPVLQNFLTLDLRRGSHSRVTEEMHLNLCIAIQILVNFRNNSSAENSTTKFTNLRRLLQTASESIQTFTGIFYGQHNNADFLLSLFPDKLLIKADASEFKINKMAYCLLLQAEFESLCTLILEEQITILKQKKSISRIETARKYIGEANPGSLLLPVSDLVNITNFDIESFTAYQISVLISQALSKFYELPESALPAFISSFESTALDLGFDSNRIKGKELLVRAYGMNYRDFLKSIKTASEHKATEAFEASEPVLISKPIAQLARPLTKQQRKEHLYQEIFENLNIPTSTVFLALCAFGLAEEKKSTLRKFDQVVAPIRQGFNKEEHNKINLSPVETFKEFCALNPPQANLRLDQLGSARLTEFFWQLCLRSYAGNVELVKSALEQELQNNKTESKEHQLASTILAEIIPRILENLNSVANFEKPKSIKFKPYHYQIEAALAAVNQEQAKPLLVLDTGIGKTETAMLISQIINKQALWCTTAGLCSSLKDRVLQGIKLKKGEVFQFDQKTRDLSPKEFQAKLQNAKHVFASYDSLKYLPEPLTDVLAKWSKDKIKFLDEAHLLDNPESARCKAINRLKSYRTFALTATPYQHRPERIGTLLHLTMPEHYPNALLLIEQLKANSSLIKTLLHTHASIFSIDDVSKIFEPFTQVSAREQMQANPNTPMVARLNVHTCNYPMTLDATAHYIDLATNPAEWIKKQNTLREDRPKIKITRAAQFISIKRLVLQPELLELGPPVSLINAAKAQVISYLQSGKKVMLVAESLNILKILADDPELKAFGIAFIHGKIPKSERKDIIKNFERDPNTNCLIGQVTTIGTGFDCRGVAKLVVLDTPKTTSKLNQLIGRIRRIITIDNADLALDAVEVVLLKPELDQEVLKLADEKQQAYLKYGTIFHKWQMQLIERRREYLLLLNKNIVLSAGNPNCVNAAIRELTRISDKVEKDRQEFKLMRGRDLAQIYRRYNTEIKHAWRDQELAGFIQNNLSRIPRPLNQLRTAALSGPEGLEIDVYLGLGLLPHNIHVFENSEKKTEQSLFKQEASRRGALCYSTSMEALLNQMESFDLLSYDTNRYVSEDFVEMIMCLKNEAPFMLLKNSLMQRESGSARDIYYEVNQDRHLLDLRILQLAGSNLQVELGLENVTAVLKFCNQVEKFCKSLAIELEKHTEKQEQAVANALMTFILNSPMIKNFKQFSYKAPSGSPFLSTFALLEPASLRIYSDSSNQLRRGLIKYIQSNENYSEIIKNLKRLTSSRSINAVVKQLIQELEPIQRGLQPDLYITSLQNAERSELVV